MIRRALALTTAALALTLAATGCGGGDKPAASPTPTITQEEKTAVAFMAAYKSGDEAKACEFAAREIGDCTTRPSVDMAREPYADGTFTNDETGTTAVVVNFVVKADPDSEDSQDEADSYAVEINSDGKVTQWEDMSDQPKNRETVVMVLGWSE